MAIDLAQTPTSFSLTGSAQLDGLIFKGIMVAATFVTTWATSHLHLTDPNFAVYLTGALVSILAGLATLVWGWLNTKYHAAKAVQAGVNLAVSGEALMQASGHGDGTQSPVPVTAASAQKIISDFGNVAVAVKPTAPSVA